MSNLEMAAWTLCVVVLAYAFFLSQILIHACSHYALSGRRRLDTWIGSMLSMLNFHTFKGWQALHHLHHRFTNVDGKDPTHPRSGQSRGSYLLQAFVQMVRFTRTPFYEKHTQRGTSEARFTDQWEPWFGLAGLALWFAAAFAYKGAPGWAYPTLLWVLPWAFGQLLMADFNFRTHEGRPPRDDRVPYRGQDTNTLRTGPWRFVNAITLGFYMHREHHVDPETCLWFLGRPHRPAARQPESCCPPVTRHHRRSSRDSGDVQSR